jgi:hypothetical protein
MGIDVCESAAMVNRWVIDRYSADSLEEIENDDCSVRH